MVFLALFLVSRGRSSSSTVCTAEVVFLSVCFYLNVIPAAARMFFNIEGVGNDVEASNVSEIDVPLTVEKIVVEALIVETRRVDDRLGIGDSSAAFSFEAGC